MSLNEQKHLPKESLYDTRPLSLGYPNIDELALEFFANHLKKRQFDARTLDRVFTYLGRLVPLQPESSILVLGCGPVPYTLKYLIDKGYDAKGVEPEEGFVYEARRFIDNEERVVQGAAESIPLPDNSQQVVVLESVLEHVDSPIISLTEIFRVLQPGGILYLTTTNRLRFNLRGDNGEYNLPFYNWFPALVKESYVFKHLHYKPGLANYSPRPAVHWFTYSDLCKVGRNAGFAQFYSFLDLVNETDASIQKSAFRRFVINKLKFNAWFRALALTQIGGSIIMLKRNESY